MGVGVLSWTESLCCTQARANFCVNIETPKLSEPWPESEHQALSRMPSPSIPIVTHQMAQLLQGRNQGWGGPWDSLKIIYPQLVSGSARI